MAATFRSTTSDTRGTAGNPCVPTLPAGTVDGDLLICVHTCDLNGSLAELTAPVGWTAQGTGGSRSDVGFMRGKTKVMHYAPIKCEVVVAQMHDASDDTLQIRAEASSATGAQTWRLSINGTEVDDLISGVALGQEVAWDIQVTNGALTVKINGTTQYTGTPGWGAGQYFKAGAYPQQNSTDQANSASEYSRVELRDLFVSHS